MSKNWLKCAASDASRSPHWVKIKNPNAPAAKREAEEDWGAESCGKASI